MEAFDKKSLLQMFAPKVVPVVVEFEGKQANLYVKELSAKQVFDLQKKQKEAEQAEPGSSSSSFTAQLVAQSLCDENGKSVMSYEDAQELAGMQVGAFGKLSEAIAKAVGLSPAPVKADGKPGNA